MKQNEKIFVAGHKGLVGSALVRALHRQGYDNLVFRTYAEMDLENQGAVFEFFERERPDCVFLAAAFVGGIYANNTYPADFINGTRLVYPMEGGGGCARPLPREDLRGHEHQPFPERPDAAQDDTDRQWLSKYMLDEHNVCKA